MGRLEVGPIVLAILAVLVFIFMVVFFVDGIGATGSGQTLSAIIWDKDYDPAYTEVTTSVDSEGNLTTSTNYVPADWDIKVEIGDYGFTWLDVTETMYDSVFIGGAVQVELFTGYFGLTKTWRVR